MHYTLGKRCHSDIETWLVEQVAKKGRRLIDVHQPFSSFGIDSVVL
jgi:hypothetical protein